jgi:excisionase family DNA binding protein
MVRRFQDTAKRKRKRPTYTRAFRVFFSRFFAFEPEQWGDMRNEDDIVLLGEVAKATGVSRMTAYIWARAGEIPARFRGGRYELRRRDLAEVVRERRRSRKAPDPGGAA